MPNLEKEISKHNQKTLLNFDVVDDNNRKLCNCRIKPNCPVDGKFLTKGVIYKATVSYKNKNHIYKGSTGREFKSRYYEHAQSFRNDIKK